MSNLDSTLIALDVHSPNTNLTKSLQIIHDAISVRYPFIERIAIALYEPTTDLLKTFVSSNDDNQKLSHYESHLNDVPSLLCLANAHHSRIVDDILTTFNFASPHTDWLKERGYRSSLTVPIYRANILIAFVFFDSKVSGSFDPDTAQFLEIFADLISQLFLFQINALHGLVGTVQIAGGLARIRDLETGQHLERVANYTRLMAQRVADHYALDDEFIEYMYLLAPLHDVGKVGIPDAVLLKPGRLNSAEWVIMERHVEIGLTITDKIAKDLCIVDSLPAKIMHNIVAYHHERGDGKGYPYRLLMDQIPIESRIVAIADVYDALSNRRPYKNSWSEDEIVAELRKEVALGRLDAVCTEAFVAAKTERHSIQEKFADIEEKNK